jgi:CelD/BcsL family acetyltransferase involved in cellulose biosynthesis
VPGEQRRMTGFMATAFTSNGDHPGAIGRDDRVPHVDRDVRTDPVRSSAAQQVSLLSVAEARDFAALGARSSIHQTPDWYETWCAAHGETPLLVGISLDGRPACLLPLSVARRSGLRMARFIATRFSNVNFPPMSQAFIARCDPKSMAALHNDLRQLLAPHADLLLLDRMPAAWRGASNPFLAFSHVASVNASFQITLHDDFEQVLRQVNAKRRRKKFRNTQRKLEEFGGYEIVHATTPADARMLLDTFFEQKSQRFDAKGLVDVFAPTRVQAFFHALAQRSVGSNDKPLAMAALRLKGTGGLAAVTGLSVSDGYVICQFGSIDHALSADASVGEQLFHHLIEECCIDGMECFDFGIGDQPYKRSWCDVETAQYDIHLPLTVRGALLAPLLRLATAAKKKVKGSARLNGLARRVQRALPHAS